MKNDFLAMFAGMGLLTVSPALAQGGAALPDRPISRQEVIAGVRSQFSAMDGNRDGVVTLAEFNAYRARTANAPQDNPFGHVGAHWFERADADGNGRVTLAEAQARPLQLFDMADLDHDGVVSVRERNMAMMLFGK